ncbi:RidA family protein [Pseudohalocynthiibacter aestuariivivens]|uniref:RidA family protein n=1 Tax=Pseudohalocynthiibacter aestuariivivens TaxID=1591409 RepID=A0ABV5JEP1_9RHOB|nr:RidA family protein [Pseudohalocynthiibacter aestuariivivens]MBS9717262.1 RidA family protein [Pseudohalocynthiibacter aestuariivivens]
MARELISSGGKWEEILGYSRAVVDGDWVFLAGTGGFEPGTGAVADSVLDQTEQCLINAATALEQAGSSLEDTVRIIVYLVDMDDFERVAPIFGRTFKNTKPANTTVASPALIDPRLKVEIEITAKKRS